jgi:hypothetical protein
MPYTNFDQFSKALGHDGWLRYMHSNSWHEPWRDGGSKDPVDENSDVKMAYELYRQVLGSSMVIALGNETLRQNETLLHNFGVANASKKVQEKAQHELILKIEQDRKDLHHPNASHSAPAEVLGPGGILSDAHWTPLLNDCLIIAGTHRSLATFHYANENFENDFLKNFQGVGKKLEMFQGSVTATPSSPGKKGLTPAASQDTSGKAVSPARSKDYRGLWLNFFLQSPGEFWSERGFPRVFTRELVGLYAANYKPVYHSLGLTFDGAGRHGLDFHSYMNAVDASGITKRDKARVFQTISKFLFGNPDTLYYTVKKAS